MSAPLRVSPAPGGEELPGVIAEMALRGIRVDPFLLRERLRTAREALKLSRDPEDARRLADLNSYGAQILRQAEEGGRVVAKWKRAECGRFSAREPALQNITRKLGLRDAFIPSRGCVFVDADWHGCHVLIAAGVSRDPVLLEDVARGHAYEIAAKVFAPELEGRAARKAGKLCALSALNGAGGGVRGISAMLEGFDVRVSAAEGLKRREAWLARYPTLAAHPSLQERPWLPLEGEMLVRALELAEPWRAVLAMHDGALFEVPEDIPDQGSAHILSAFARAAVEVLELPEMDPSVLAAVSVRRSWSGEGPVGDAPLITCAADVVTRPIEWLWKEWFPFGAVSIVDGAPSAGKTTFLLDVIARASRGELGGGEAVVSLIAPEQGIEDTITPMLRVAKAALRNVYFLRSKDGESDIHTLPNDIARLEAHIEKTGARIVLLDTLMTYMGVDTHKDSEVQRALAPLADLAIRRRIAIIGTRHLRKTREGGAMNAGQGSTGFNGKARAVHLVAKNPEVKGELLFACVKPMGRSPPSLRWRMVADPGGFPRVEVLGSVDLSADDALSAAPPPREESGALSEAMDWLRGQFGTEAIEVKEIRKRALADGFTWRTMERAKKQLQMRHGRSTGGSKDWYWFPPPLYPASPTAAQLPSDSRGELAGQEF